MSLHIHWRSCRGGRCVARLAIAAALAAPVPALAGPDPRPGPDERVTAREAVERQFAAAPAPAGAPAMSGAEAALILEKYRARIGKMLEPKRETGGGRAER